MKLFSKGIGILALSALLFSCDNDDDCDCGPNELGVPISLSSRVTFEQRLQDLQIAEGQSLSFFVTLAGSTNTVLYDNYKIMADGEGGFTYAQTMYYPVNDDNVDFYGIHPYSEGASINRDLPFSVNANQTTENGYLTSDLLYATSENVRRSTNTVSMTFKHMLAKIDITVVQGGGVDISGLQSIRILNLVPNTTIEPETGDLGPATGSSTTITPYGIPTDIGTQTSVDGITAIVVPQTVNAGEPLLAFTIDDVDYTYAPKAPINFESGLKYGFTITVNQTDIDVSSTITPWQDGGSISGEGSID